MNEGDLVSIIIWIVDSNPKLTYVAMCSKQNHHECRRAE